MLTAERVTLVLDTKEKILETARAVEELAGQEAPESGDPVRPKDDRHRVLKDMALRLRTESDRLDELYS